MLCGKANPAFRANGVNVVVDTYATELFKMNCDVEVWCIAQNPYSNRQCHDYPISYFQQYPGHLKVLDHQLLKSLKRLSPQNTIIHFHSAFIVEFYLITLLFPRLKYVITPHGVFATNSLRRNRLLKTVYWKLIEQRFVARAERLMLLSPNELGDMPARDTRPDRLSLVPNGTGMKAVLPRAGTPGSHGPIRWGYVGRIENPQKAIYRLIDSFVVYQQINGADSSTLTLVGDGPESERIQTMYASQIRNGSIILAGRLSGDELVQMYASFDYFITVSNWEGMPLSCLDAIGARLPLIITTETNLKSYVEEYECGIVVPGDEEAIAEGMANLCRSDYQELQNNCSRLAEKEFNWHRIVKDLLQIYHDILHTHPAAV